MRLIITLLCLMVPLHLTAAPKRIVIAPFENTSIVFASRFDLYKVGLAELISAELRELGTRSISQEELLSAAGRTEVIKARNVDAGYLVTGKFDVLAETIRVSISLIETERGTELLSESFTARTGNIPELQYNITAALAAGLELDIAPRNEFPEGSLKPLKAFSLGLSAYRSQELETADKFFEQAISIDPLYRSRIDYIINANRYLPGRVVKSQGLSSTSRRDAIRMANQSAVQQQLDSMLNPKGTPVDETTQALILDDAEKFISSTTVTSEEKQGTQHRVSVETAVLPGRIAKVLTDRSLVENSTTRPSAVLLFNETHEGLNNPPALTEHILARSIESAGIELIPLEQVSIEQIRGRLEQQNEASEAASLVLPAQYLIVAQSTLSYGGDQNGETVYGKLQAQVYDGRNFEPISTNLIRKMSTDQSLEKSLRNVIHYSSQAITESFLFPTIQQRFNQFRSAGIPLALKINAADNEQTNAALLHYLKDLPQVAAATLSGWDEDDRYLELDVQYRGNSSELANLLDGLSIYETVLNVVTINPDDLEIELSVTEELE